MKDFDVKALGGAKVPEGVKITKQLTREVDGKKASIFIGVDGNNKKVRYTLIDGKMEELQERTTAGKNTYVTKKEADAIIMQMLGTKGVPAGVTIKFETDQNGTVSPKLLFKGEKLDAKGMKLLAQQQRVADMQNEELAKAKEPEQKGLPEHVKIAVDIAKNIKFDEVAETKDLAAVTPEETKPQGTKYKKKAPSGMEGRRAKAADTPASKKAIEAAKKRGTEKTEKSGTIENTTGIKKPEEYKPSTIKGTETPWGKPITAPRVTSKDIDKVQKAKKDKLDSDNGFKMGRARIAAKGGAIDRNTMHEHIRNINNISEGNVMKFLNEYDKGNGDLAMDIIRQLAKYNTPASKNAAIKLLEGACKENNNNPAIQSVLQSIEKGPLNWTEYARTADTVLWSVMHQKH